MTVTIRIGVHDGSFHADDVLAVAILSTIYPDHSIIRSRDPDVLEMMDILVDVGCVYDHSQRRYDHHMPDPPTDHHGHLLSSAGLIWRHYAHTYLRSIKIPATFNVNGDTFSLLDQVERYIHTKWIYPIDRVDNGVTHGPTPISDLVRALRPIEVERSRERYNELFMEAVSLVSKVFYRYCFHACDYVITKTRAQCERKEHLFDNRVVVSGYEFDHTRSFGVTPAHFLIHPRGHYNDDENFFVVRPVIDPYSRMYKSPFPSEILGQDTSVVEEVLGLKGVVYVHHAGFMAHVDTKENALALCEKLLTDH